MRLAAEYAELLVMLGLRVGVRVRHRVGIDIGQIFKIYSPYLLSEVGALKPPLPMMGLRSNRHFIYYSYDVILILQDSGHSVANLLPVSDLAKPDIWDSPELSACQISTWYLNPRPSYYYYFWLLKTNVRHI